MRARTTTPPETSDVADGGGGRRVGGGGAAAAVGRSVGRSVDGRPSGGHRLIDRSIDRSIDRRSPPPRSRTSPPGRRSRRASDASRRRRPPPLPSSCGPSPSPPDALAGYGEAGRDGGGVAGTAGSTRRKNRWGGGRSARPSPQPTEPRRGSSAPTRRAFPSRRHRPPRPDAVEEGSVPPPPRQTTVVGVDDDEGALATPHNPQRWIPRVPHPRRTRRSAIAYVNCRTTRIVQTLNANSAPRPVRGARPSERRPRTTTFDRPEPRSTESRPSVRPPPHHRPPRPPAKAGDSRGPAAGDQRRRGRTGGSGKSRGEDPNVRSEVPSAARPPS